MTVERVISETKDQFPIGMRVLAVDDDPTCLLLLETMLRRCRYNVTTTNQAVTALKLLRENKNRFDLVISDVHMPDMDGFKLLELVGLEMDLPVIMLSANGDTKLVMKGITHGACDYLLKPVRIEELQNIWQHVVRRKKFDRKDRYNSGSQDKTCIYNGVAAGIVNVDQNGKLNKMWKDQNEDEDEECDENGHDNEDPATQKKPRVVWSVELHHKFVAAVKQMGIDKAVPKKILELMNVEKLPRENVASHLQALILNFPAIAGPDQLHNEAFRSFSPSGVLGRLNTPAGLGMHGLPSPGMTQLSHVQNLVNTSNDQSKLLSFVIPGNHNANILLGMPMSLELDQLQNNKGVSHIGELLTADNTTVFPVSGSLINARTTGCSNNPLLGVTNNSLMSEGNSYQATLHANLQGQASPISCNAGQIIRSAPQEWNAPRKDAHYQSNGAMVQLGQCLDQNNPIFHRNMDLDCIGPSNFVDPLSIKRSEGENSAMEPSVIQKEGYLAVQPRPQGSYIPDNIGSLEDLASAMMKRVSPIFLILLSVGYSALSLLQIDSRVSTSWNRMKGNQRMAILDAMLILSGLASEIRM
ncbi:hypothetical protein CRYUN_Cryun33cG0104500 [Craigia yunnanensis]